MRELEVLAMKFRGRCRDYHAYHDLKQDVWVIYLEHKDKYDCSKSKFNTWCNNYLFKKVLTYVESASFRNQARNIPTEELPEQGIPQLGLDAIRAIRTLTEDDKQALQIYDPKLNHHRRGPFARRVEKIKNKIGV